MTKWGKFLRFFGRVRHDELEWILYRILGLRADQRRWESRYRFERDNHTFDGITDLWCGELRAKFTQTRIAKVHGWCLEVGDSTSSPEYIYIRIFSPTVDVEHLFKIWVYDVNAFLKACEGKGGLNMDDTNWMLNHVTTIALKDVNKTI